jgi:tellurite resistance protein
MATVTRGHRSVTPTAGLDLDRALIALFIGAMNANDHVAPDEAERAHHLIWSTRRFRRRSGDAVGKLIDDMRSLAEQSDAGAVMDRATKAIPARLRPSAFALVADLLLADGKLDARERKFLQRLGSELKLDRESVRQVIEVVLLKNRL